MGMEEMIRQKGCFRFSIANFQLRSKEGNGQAPLQLTIGNWKLEIGI